MKAVKKKVKKENHSRNVRLADDEMRGRERWYSSLDAKGRLFINEESVIKGSNTFASRG